MADTPYDAAYFGTMGPGSLCSAQVVLPPVVDRLRPASALDIGCGVGAWARTLVDLGVDARGLDGDYVQPAQLLIPPERFSAVDLVAVLASGFAGEATDLAVCLEVAEHLPERCARQLVAFLARAGRAVLFSAATPRQGGETHVNEQWQSYWRDLFRDEQLEAYDVVRPAVWRDSRVDAWYAQNTLLYVREGDAGRFGLGDAQRPVFLDVVHPGIDEFHAWQRANPKVTKAAGYLTDAAAGFVGAAARSAAFHARHARMRGPSLRS